MAKPPMEASPSPPGMITRPSLEPIHDDDLLAYCTFLNQNLNPAIAPATWVDAFRQPWGPKPNNGFLLRDSSGQIVGGIGAIYATRDVKGQSRRLCNITSWCVLEPYRAHSLRLAMAVVSQTGFKFTDLSPSPVVAGSLRFLKFKDLDSRATVLPNLPAWTPGVQVTGDHHVLDRVLTPEDAAVFRDHQHLPWLSHVAVGRSGRFCHVVYKRGTMKRLPCAVVLHVSAPDLFWRFRVALGHFFLQRHGMVTTRVETRFLPRRSSLSVQVLDFNIGMYRSDVLAQEDVWNLYSERAALDL